MVAISRAVGVPRSHFAATVGIRRGPGPWSGDLSSLGVRLEAVVNGGTGHSMRGVRSSLTQASTSSRTFVRIRHVHDRGAATGARQSHKQVFIAELLGTD